LSTKFLSTREDKMPGVRFGHAATIVEGKKGTAAEKIEQFKNA
jgi:succinyl-CoA synthetase alpha subunit